MNNDTFGAGLVRRLARKTAAPRSLQQERRGPQKDAASSPLEQRHTQSDYAVVASTTPPPIRSEPEVVNLFELDDDESASNETINVVVSREDKEKGQQRSIDNAPSSSAPSLQSDPDCLAPRQGSGGSSAANRDGIKGSRNSSLNTERDYEQATTSEGIMAAQAEERRAATSPIQSAPQNFLSGLFQSMIGNPMKRPWSGTGDSKPANRSTRRKVKSPPGTKCKDPTLSSAHDHDKAKENALAADSDASPRNVSENASQSEGSRDVSLSTLTSDEGDHRDQHTFEECTTSINLDQARVTVTEKSIASGHMALGTVNPSFRDTMVSRDMLLGALAENEKASSPRKQSDLGNTTCLPMPPSEDEQDIRFKPVSRCVGTHTSPTLASINHIKERVDDSGNNGKDGNSVVDGDDKSVSDKDGDDSSVSDKEDGEATFESEEEEDDSTDAENLGKSARPKRQTLDRSRKRCSSCAGCKSTSCGYCTMCMRVQTKRGAQRGCVFRPCLLHKESTRHQYHSKAKRVMATHPDDTHLVSLWKSVFESDDAVWRARNNDQASFSQMVCNVRSRQVQTNANSWDPSSIPDTCGSSKSHLTRTQCAVALPRLRSRAEQGGASTQCAVSLEQVPSASHRQGNKHLQSKHVRYKDPFHEADIRGLVKGSRVYAEWQKNSWYWGIIVNRYLHERRPYFTVRFDDGDERSRMEHPKMLITVDEFKEEFGTADIPQKPMEYSVPSKFAVGARVYAPWTPDEYFYGEITKKEAGRDYVEVTFDDGDVDDKISLRDLFLEEESKASGEYKGNALACPPSIVKGEGRLEMPTCDSLDIRSYNDYELEQHRCNVCEMCRSNECGKCECCSANRKTTSVHRFSCHFRMCSRLSPIEKGRKIDNMTGWRFLVDSPSNLAAPLQLAPFPQLKGFCVFLGEEACSSIESALKASGWKDRKKIARFARTFYRVRLGLSEFQLDDKEHVLVGQGYVQCWIDHQGRTSELRGEITKCTRSVYDSSRAVFTVEYNESSLRRVDATLCGPINKSDDRVSEEDAWRGAVKYAAGAKWTLIQEKPDFVHTWHVPAVRRKETLEGQPGLFALIFTYGNHEIRLEPRKSGVAGAGLGLFASCTPLGPGMVDESFLLESGHLIDLGPYGPLRQTDWRSETISLLKKLLFVGKPEGWNFDTSSPHGGVIDITDDSTGELHPLAAANPIVYANETDGRAVPSLTPCFDPTGAIHYLLGHANPATDNFRLLAGKVQELKIDYGPDYESVRVGKGYSRLSTEAQQKVRGTIAREDVEIIRTISSFSAKEVNDCIIYMEENRDGLRYRPERALLAASAFVLRLQALENEFKDVVVCELNPQSFCDNGYSQLDEWETSTRARALLADVRNCFAKDEDLYAAIRDDPKLCDIPSMLHLGSFDEHSSSFVSAEGLCNKIKTLASV